MDSSEKSFDDLLQEEIRIEDESKIQEHEDEEALDEEIRLFMQKYEEEKKREKEKKDLNGTLTFDIPWILLMGIGFGFFNFFLFFYNIGCIEYYQEKIDGAAQVGIVYNIYKYIKDYYIVSMIEKIFYIFAFLYVLQMIIGMILNHFFGKSAEEKKKKEKKKEEDSQEGESHEGGELDEGEDDDSSILPGFGIGGLGGSLFGGGRGSKFRIEKKGKTGVSIEDVAGCHIAKKELFELIDFLKNQERYKALGAKLPRGALLYGPSGTGKTMIAKALANEVSYNYIYVQGSEFKKPLVGLGSMAVRELFEKARKNAPCIIFIDEIDSIAKKRGTGGEMTNGTSGEDDVILNTFLAELDGFKERGDVFVMGATNRLNVIDPALLRPKRFDRIIHFKLPNIEERVEIIKSYYGKMKMEGKLKEPKKIREIAKKSFGFSGAQIFNMCNEAAILAGRVDAEVIREEDMMKALDYIHLGKEEEHIRKHLTEEEKRRTAYHETGHAIVAIMRMELENPTQISIVPHNKGSLGVTLTPLNEYKYSQTREDYIARLCMLLGGRMAEEIYVGNISGGAKDDLNRFNQLVDDYFQSGIENIYFVEKDSKVSDTFLEKIEMEKRAFIEMIYGETRKILTENREKIELITAELLEKEDMYENDIEKYYL